MKQLTRIFILIAMFSGLMLPVGKVSAQQADSLRKKPQPMRLSYQSESSEYQELLSGPPSTVGMYSGFVTLKPGDTVGHHNTEVYEEMLVIISGEGKMLFDKGVFIELKPGIAAYCPPNTEHDVKCTGKEPLKYIYIASKTIQ